MPGRIVPVWAADATGLYWGYWARSAAALAVGWAGGVRRPGGGSADLQAAATAGDGGPLGEDGAGLSPPTRSRVLSLAPARAPSRPEAVLRSSEMAPLGLPPTALI